MNTGKVVVYVLFLGICIVMALNGYAIANGCADQTREYYDKMCCEAWGDFDKKNYFDSLRKFEEVYKWAETRTNDVLRYKSAGGLVQCYVEILNGRTLITQQQYDCAMELIDIIERVGTARIPAKELDDKIKNAMLRQAAEWRGKLASMKGKIVGRNLPRARGAFAKNAKEGDDIGVREQFVTSGEIKQMREAIDGEDDKERIISNYYADAPSVFGSFRGLVTVVTSPGELISFRIVFSPVVGIVEGVYEMGCDIVFGLGDFVSLGWVGDWRYVNSGGEKPWLFELIYGHATAIERQLLQFKK